jgi:excisionase family DNA binding protein
MPERKTEREVDRKMREQAGLLTLAEVAARLGTSEGTVYNRISSGELKSVHFGYRHYVSKLSVEAYIMRSGGKKAMSAQKTESSADA